MSLCLRRVRPIFMVMLVMLSTLWAGAVFATTVKYMDLAALIEDSDVIVRGEVISQEYKFDAERKNVMTHYTVRVSQTFMGKTAQELEFVQWGGEWNGMASKIPGDATFAPKEDTVLFLNEHQGVLYLTALGQSKYTVEKAAGKTMIVRDLSDIGLFKDGDAAVPHVAKGEVERMAYDTFVPELESLIAAIKGGAK